MNGPKVVPVDAACPQCKKPIKGLVQAHGEHAEPRPGDLSICMECLLPLRFDAGMKLEVMSEEDLAKVPEHEQNMIRQGLKVMRLAKGAFAMLGLQKPPADEIGDEGDGCGDPDCPVCGMNAQATDKRVASALQLLQKTMPGMDLVLIGLEPVEPGSETARTVMVSTVGQQQVKEVLETLLDNMPTLH